MPTGKSLIGPTSCSLQSSEESQRCAVTDVGQLQMQGLLQQRPSHSYSGRLNQCVAQKSDSWREITGCSGYAVDTSTYSTSDLRQNQSRLEEGSAGLQSDHFIGGRATSSHVLPQETSQVVGPKECSMWQSSLVLQQSVGKRLYHDEIVDSVEDFSKKSSNQVLTSAAGCSSLKQSQSENSGLGLSNQLMTKPTQTDWPESSKEEDIQCNDASNQPCSTISSSLGSSTAQNNSHGSCPDTALTDLLSSCLTGGSIDKGSSGKVNADGFCSNAAPSSACLVDKTRSLANDNSLDFEEESPTDDHDSEKQSHINSFPCTEEKSCHSFEPRICSSVGEDRRRSHWTTDEDFSPEEKLTLKRQTSVVDDKIKSDRQQSRCALAAASPVNSFRALEIGSQVDGCNNGRDSTEEQSTGVSPPLDHPPLPPPAPPLTASLENATEEAAEASAVASAVDGALFHSGAAAATVVISRSLTCSSPAITNNGETNKCDERGLESVAGEERGRGKRKRKVVSYSRYLEMSSSDDEGASDIGLSRRKCLKSSHRMNSPDENCVAKTNGQQQKAVAASRCHSNDAVVAAAEDDCDRRSSAGGSVSTDNVKSRRQLGQGTSSSTDSPTVGQMSPRDEQKARSSLLCPASVLDGGSMEKHSAAVAEESKEEVATVDKQQRIGREKELELEVTNENGEVEIVTIVDLHSSSDEADLLAMNGEDEIIPLTDNESDAPSSDCEHRQPDMSAAAAGQSMMQSVQKDGLSSSVTAASSSEIPRVGLDLIHSASRKLNDKGRSDRAEQVTDDLSAVAGPSHETKTGSTDRTTVNKKSLRKKRKRVRPGDDFSEFGSDAEDYDKVHRLKKMYGMQKQTKPVKTSQVQNSATDKTTTSSSGSLVGPYVRLIGSKEMPVSCKVVNVKDPVDLDAPHSKSKKNLLLPESSCVPSSLKFLDSVPWICLFCGHGSAYSMLGDLFGPYYPQSVKSDISEPKPKTLCVEKQSPPSKSAAAADKVLRSPRRLSSRLRTNSCDSLHEGSGNLPQELWVHEECAVWTSGVYLARGKLQGLEEAALVAAQVVSLLLSLSVCGNQTLFPLFY